MPLSLDTEKAAKTVLERLRLDRRPRFINIIPPAGERPLVIEIVGTRVSNSTPGITFRSDISHNEFPSGNTIIPEVDFWELDGGTAHAECHVYPAYVNPGPRDKEVEGLILATSGGRQRLENFDFVDGRVII